MTMDSARKERARDHRPERGAKRQGDPWGPRDTRSGEKRKRERSQAQGFAVDVVTAFDAHSRTARAASHVWGQDTVRDSASVPKEGANESIS